MCAWKLGSLADFREQQLQAIKAEVGGEEHPVYLDAIVNFAFCYNYYNRKDDAVQLRERIVEICQRALGSGHEDTSDATRYLAQYLEDKLKGQLDIEVRINKIMETSRSRDGVPASGDVKSQTLSTSSQSTSSSLSWRQRPKHLSSEEASRSHSRR